VSNRLLIIDDDPDLVEIYARIAETAGYQVKATGEPGEFWAAVSEWSPTVIIIDLRMPKCDGIEVLRGLAERQVRAHVMLASGSDPSLLEIANRIGIERGLAMKQPLPKPVAHDTLRVRLEGLRAQATTVTQAELRSAIERHEIRLHYQPKVDLRTRRPVGVEALVRWRSPTRGDVSPANFVPFAEQTGLIDLLTKEVLTQALTQMAEWRAAGLAISVAVNVSPVNLKSLSFPEEIVALCDDVGADRTLLVLEVTETATHDDPTTMMDILTRLRLRDFRLSIDDFGTGHSSLMKLHRLPFSELKLDRSFIIEARTSKRALLITRSTIELAHSLDIKVVGEGIEDADTAAIMTEMGCDVGQGFHFYTPMSAEMIPNLFESASMRDSGHLEIALSLPV
jgi:EAL domain-containing protein (putative c-di-GMP-specific phosphodiesterase class I)